MLFDLEAGIKAALAIGAAHELRRRGSGPPGEAVAVVVNQTQAFLRPVVCVERLDLVGVQPTYV